MPRTNPSLSALGARWQALAPREQRLLLAASALVLLALLWWLALAPALHTLRSAGPRHSALDAQLQHMQSLQAEALQLQAQPRIRPDDAQRALQTSVAETLGASARLSLNGDRATLTLQGAPAGALATWLAQARSNARAVPQETHLTRSAPKESRAGAAAPAARPPANAAVRWDGTIVLALPPR
ncbi:MAG: type II secretion system protein GspM [Giesbergeria sp.]|jgi:general secretion pathway protein M|nr:type II secretion system protein GspM [Giesbergeria sp.]